MRVKSSGKIDSPKFRKGDKVVCVGASYGFGEVKLGDIGVVADYLGEDVEYIVDFPNQRGWSADEADIVLSKEYKVKKLLEKLNEA